VKTSSIKALKEVAWIGDEYVKHPRGIVLWFHGLGRLEYKFEPTMQELVFADAGGLVVHAYYGAWHWMNRQTRAFIDDLIASLYKAYKLPKRAPVVITGESMGGQCGLLYTRYSKHKLAGCAVNCPVCDLEYSMYERGDVARTIHHAFRGYKGTLKALLKEHSPVGQVAKFPRIPYHIIHGVKDEGVHIKPHSDQLVPLMRKRGLDVDYHRVEGMNHCSPMPQAVWQSQTDFVTRLLNA